MGSDGDLRAFIAQLEQCGDLARVPVEVDPDQEIGAICSKVTKAGGPALLFEHVRGLSMPLLSNVWGTRRRYAMALGTDQAHLYEHWTTRVGAGGIPPVRVEHAASQDCVRTGSQVDLHALPIPTWNEKDSGAYITAGLCMTQDADTGVRNVGVYRMMRIGPDTATIAVDPRRAIMRHKASYERQGRRLPVAICIGADPVVSMAAAAPFPDGVDEIAMAGALRGRPVEMVRARTVDLDVPASAEIILEGELEETETHFDGPFGEYHGTYGHRQPHVPVMRITAITHRADPIYQGLYLGVPLTENQVFEGVPVEIEVRRQVGLSGVITGFNLVDSGCRFVAIVQIRKQVGGQGKAVGLAVLGCPKADQIRMVIVVDDDVDPFDPQAVYWAMATRCVPAEDVEVLRNLPTTRIDLLLSEAERQSHQYRTSKLVIDATRPVGDERFDLCLPSQQARDLVASRWSDYRIP